MARKLSFSYVYINPSAGLHPFHLFMLLIYVCNVRRYVYERLTPNQKPTFKNLMVTQLVSGVWHGLYPGYIMFFAGAFD